ncbi:MAG: GHKL domain-containing protein [Clostridia bacterium]|nr:GHKL domain-containing protein [Clostridia bacterium]
MEILNVVLSYVALYAQSIALSYMIYIIACIICKESIQKPIKCILLNSIIIFALHAFSNLLITISWLKPVLSLLIYAVSTKFILKIKKLPALFSIVIAMVASAIIELFIVFGMKLLNIDAIDVKSNSTYNTIMSFIISIFFFVIPYFSYKIYKKFILKDTDTGVDNIANYLLPQFITMAICLIPSMALLMKNDYENSAAFIVINIVQLVVISLVSVYNIKNVIKQKDTELQLENTITHNQTLMKVNEGVRGFKHDMGNIVQAILGYIALNDAEGAKKFCQNLVIGFNDINILSILSPKVINDPAVYGVVVNKILVAREYNMELTLDITSDIKAINFPKFELSRILGILIDNAIEAGQKTEDKKLILTIHTSQDDLYDEIIISNSVNTPDIPIEKIFEKDYSSKENPSGFGLYEVKQLFEKFSQGIITTSIDKDSMLFTQKIKIFR